MKDVHFHSEVETSYQDFLRSSFEVHYKSGTDVWTQDRSLHAIAQFANHFMPKEGNVLDVGTGRGRDASYFLCKGHRVCGVDLLETEEVGHLKKNSKFHFRLGHFQDLNLQHRFDVVLDNGSFHHQDPLDFEKYLKNIFLHLKAGGHFIVSVYTPFNETAEGKAGHLADGRKGRSFSLWELRSLVESVGFEFVESKRFLHESGTSYYLAASFRKPIHARVLLMTPLARTVLAASRTNFHTTSLWHELKVQDPLYPVLAEVQQDSNVFLTFDLNSEIGIEKAIESLKKMDFSQGIYNGPDEYLSATIKIFAALGLARNQESTFRIMHNKDLLRKHLEEVGLSPVKTEVVRSAADLIRAHEKIGFPMILKPSRGGGSKNIQLIQNEGELIATYQLLNFDGGANYIAEEFLEGLQVSVEVVTHGEGNHKIIGMTEKFDVLPPNFVEWGGIFPARLESQAQAQVEGLVTAMLNSLHYKWGGSHTELILTQDGPRIIETHARIGGLIPFLVQGAMDLSIEECLLNPLASAHPTRREMAMLKFLELPQGRKVKDIRKTEQPNNLPFVVRSNLWIKKDHVVPVTINNDTRHGYVVVKGKSLAELESNMQCALKLLEAQILLEEPHS